MAAALGVSSVELSLIEEFLHRSAAEATADFIRIYSPFIPKLSEKLGSHGSDTNYDHEPSDLFAAVHSLQECKRGSLGWSLCEFYRRNQMSPLGKATPEPSYCLYHDMNHVISGYEPTGPGAIALGAFKLAMDDSESNWLASLGNF